MDHLARFNFFLKLPGKIYREQAGRLTKSVRVDHQEAFVKLHFGVGLKEIFKNLLQGRLPILGARTEYTALKKLAALNIPSLEVLEFGEFGLNPASKHSYLVTKALTDVMSLEALGELWRTQPPNIKFKREVIREIARIAKEIHAHGLNHRDFYLCHFLLDEAYYRQHHQVKLYLIDLHRAQIRAKTPWRWCVKDIAGLYFSALKLPLTRKDLFCFMCSYGQREAFLFWQEVEQKAWLLYEKTYFKNIRGIFKKIVYDPTAESKILQTFLEAPDEVIGQAKLLKDDGTTTVACFEDKLIFKRYNVRSFSKGLKRLFKQSRARRCWLQALRLRHLGLYTPRPIAMIERLRFGCLRESYIVMEYLSGQDLFIFLRQHPEQIEPLANQIYDLFQSLKNIRTAHGDFKATNLWFFQGKIYLLDLDGVRQYEHEEKLSQAIAKDKRRFLKNWSNQEAFQKVFESKIYSQKSYFLDARKLPCPQPVAEAKKLMKNLCVGEVLTIWCKDEMTVLDFKGFFSTTPHELISITQNLNYFELKVKKK